MENKFTINLAVKVADKEVFVEALEKMREDGEWIEMKTSVETENGCFMVDVTVKDMTAFYYLGVRTGEELG